MINSKIQNLALLAYVCICMISCWGSLIFLDFKEKQALETRFKRLETIYPFLPKNITYIGYLSDLAYPVYSDATYAESKAKGSYIISQYAFAPYILTNHAQENWVFGDFYNSNHAAAVINKHHLKIVRDYGHGLMLLQPVEGPSP